jgi:outer membrane protein W
MSFKSSCLFIILLLLSWSSIFSQNKVGHFSLGLQSGVLIPFGDNKGIASEQMGISNGLTIKYFPSENFAMGMSLRVMNNNFQAQTKANNVPITQVPFTFDFDWYPTDWRLKPYVGFGAGLSFFTVTPVAGLVNTLKEIPDTYTTPAYLVTGKAGFKYQLSDRFSIHAEGTYYKVAEPGEAFLWKQNDGTVYRQFSNKASFTLGLLYHFDE